MNTKKTILYSVCTGLGILIGVLVLLKVFGVPTERMAVDKHPGTGIDRTIKSVTQTEKTHPDVLAARSAVLNSGRFDRNARSIYWDESADLETRFSSLMEMADSGDRDALHLAFQLQRSCSIWMKLSPEMFVSETWKPEMGTALSILQGKCAGLLQTPESQKLTDSTKNLPNDAFDHDVREKIRRAFADGGADMSVSEGLKAYQARPDSTTATLIANTLGELDVTNYDPNLALTGTNALSPNYRQSIFETALDLLACDYGEACGPNSVVVSSLCINSGVCMPGYTLDQIYENVMLSGEDLQNVKKILEYFRRLSAPNR